MGVQSKSLRADIAREKDARVVTEGRHGQELRIPLLESLVVSPLSLQRVMTLRELAADVADDRKKR